MFNPDKIREDFPIFKRKINGKSLVYLDNAATSQKPRVVIEGFKNFYESMNANVHRGLHTLSEEATVAYENTREKVASFINATSSQEIVFTRNCTEAFNLVAYSYAEGNIKKDDEIMVSSLEHHSNLVPWQELARRKRAKLKIIPLKDDFDLDYEVFDNLLSKKTKLVCVTAMSNVLGIMPNIRYIISQAHKVSAVTVIDAAQYVAHLKVDVREWDCDFLTFSAHKMLGPTGVGVLYGKEKLLESMPPFLFGGDMVHVVSQYKATFNDLPWRFEAGTPNFADVIVFKEAIDYLEKLGYEHILTHDRDLLKKARKTFSKYQGVKMFLPQDLDKVGSALSFTISGIHPHDIAAIFNQEGVAIRSGHHCAMPLHEEWLKVPATARMSFYVYNTEEDIERAEKALKEVLRIFMV